MNCKLLTCVLLKIYDYICFSNIEFSLKIMIGIFDSGVGGLSILMEVRKALPSASIIYYADNAHCPYGEKTNEFIIERSRFITKYLISKGAEIIIVACNTASAAAIKTLRTEFHNYKFIGMEPAVKPASTETKTGIIGVLATASTLQAEKYHLVKERFAGSTQVIEKVGKGFVEIVEQGITGGPLAESVVKKSIKPLVDAGADNIVLGCTHYPFLKDTITKVASELAPEREIKIIDPSPAVVTHLIDVMKEEGIRLEDESPILILESSGDDTLLKTMAEGL